MIRNVFPSFSLQVNEWASALHLNSQPLNSYFVKVKSISGADVKHVIENSALGWKIRKCSDCVCGSNSSCSTMNSANVINNERERWKTSAKTERNANECVCVTIRSDLKALNIPKWSHKFHFNLNCNDHPEMPEH